MSIDTNSLFVDTVDAFYPDREAGSVLMAYGDPFTTTGLLLQPPASRKGSVTALGQQESQLRVVGAEPAGMVSATTFRSPDGLPTVYESEESFEIRLSSATAPVMS